MIAWAAIIFCAFAGSGRHARASLQLGLELSGFLLSSSYRSDGWSSLFAGVDTGSEGMLLRAHLDARAHLALTEARSVTFHLPSSYLAIGSERAELSVGRRALEWSRMDERWGLGIFNPRFLWNPLRPETDALTGAFARFAFSHFRFAVFATFVSVPELGHNVAAAGGRLRSSSPWFVPPPFASSLMGRDLSIAYSLVDPDLSAALMRPGAIARAEWTGLGGAWLATAGGLLPMHQADLALDAYFDLRDARLHADLLPRFGTREVYLLEMGYRRRDWSVWTSVLREVPHLPAPPTGWITRPAGPATLVSAGANVLWRDRLRLGAAALWVNESPVAPPGAAEIPGAEAITLPGRFPAERALQLESAWKSARGLPEPSARWTMDLDEPGGFVAADLAWRLRGGIHISTGFEHPYSRSARGWFGSYREQDRVWGKFSYEL